MAKFREYLSEAKDHDLNKIIRTEKIKNANQLEDYLLKHHTMYHKKIDDMAKVVQSSVVDILKVKFKK